MTSTFTTEAGAVVMLTGRGSIRLSEQSVTALLDIYQREEAHGLFNELWEARRELKPHCPAAEPIPTLRLITTQVRKLDPSVWENV